MESQMESQTLSLTGPPLLVDVSYQPSNSWGTPSFIQEVSVLIGGNTKNQSKPSIFSMGIFHKNTSKKYKL